MAAFLIFTVWFICDDFYNSEEYNLEKERLKKNSPTINLEDIDNIEERSQAKIGKKLSKYKKIIEKCK